ncbi:MAG: biotin synthase BioB, partial [Spirochaetota bacterium]|nr:biotin synthase BioB [Spirochaetota bacterium]
MERIVHEGYVPAKAEAIQLMDPAHTALDALMDAAKAITKRHFGNTLSMCAIHAAKMGGCGSDCAFCAQSAQHTCAIHNKSVEENDPDAIIARAHTLRIFGVLRFGLITSGEWLGDAEFERMLGIFRTMRAETNLRLCASLGLLDAARARRLAECGVTRYHHNIETAESFFPNICTAHSYADRLETICAAREAGMEICCGGIISMGESPAQRVEMAYAIREIQADSVPINILNPIAGTRLEAQPILGVEEILRAIALFRLILPDATLSFAGGRPNATKEQAYRG